MVFGSIVSSPRGDLSSQQLLELANGYLEAANRTKDPAVTLVFCHDTEDALSQAKNSSKRSKDQAMREGVGTAYIGLGKVLENRGHSAEAQVSYKKAEKLGVKVQDQGQLAQPLDPKSGVHSAKGSSDSTTGTMAVGPSPAASKTQPKGGNKIAMISPLIFAEDVRPSTTFTKLPEPDERLVNTPQLACCLSLLKAARSLDDSLQPIARNWLLTVENDPDEHERLKVLVTDVMRAYKRDELKDAKAVAEVVCLSPALDRDAFRDLLTQFYDGISQSDLLNFHQLDGLAYLIQGVAEPGYLDADDLVKILDLLSKRLRDTHQQSPGHIYQLTMAASRVLDAMVDTNVERLDREKLHEPFSSYLNSMKDFSDPYMVYQIAYAYQALQSVPDNESLWKATLRRAGKVIKGVSGLVSAVKGLDLNGFIEGLNEIQKGLAGATEIVQLAITAYDDVNALTKSGKGFLDCLKEGFSFKRKCAWYTALRGADALIREGEFVSFKKLVCEAPCRLDPAFQWGVCQRLGEIATNQIWDTRTRRNAIAFLGEIYRNDEEWGHQESVKEWILTILIQFSTQSESVMQLHGTAAETLLQDLTSNADAQNQALLQACREKDPHSYPLMVGLPPLGSPSLLDRVQNKPDVEGNLRQLRKQRLKEQGDAVYIHPQAKANLQAPDEERFPLMEKVTEFLKSNQKVFLLLGDSGAGKSTFNRYLECELWQAYKKTNGTIPLFISLPSIDKPEQDMIAKHLRKAEFTEPEIRELKIHRKLILICDGYDESQQTHNLYMSNRLNQSGEWSAQMIISCRSEYLGVDYRDRFQPGDRNKQSDTVLFQEAVITPFTPDQVEDYIDQYVIIRQPLWEAKEYKETLEIIPSLKELVKNPFLMTLSLEVLPRMVDPGQQLSTTQVTRVALYDHFIEHWLERGKKRLAEKELSPQAKAAFESLIDEGFTQNGIDFLKKLAVAIYKEQGGQPIVKYSRFKDSESWKFEFFNREDEKQLLREACPLTRSGNQHRFVHRSLLEYGLALAVFDPLDWKEKTLSGSVSSRRGSTSSDFSFHIHGATEEVTAPIDQGPDENSPLVWRYFINEPLVLQFLEERAQQEPIFKQQLLGYIEHSKTDAKWRTAAANAITILVRAGVQFNSADLRGIRIPGADLSYGMFDSAQFQGSDLRKVSFRNVWLRQADLSGALMAGVQFGELPLLREGSDVYSCEYSPDAKSFAVGLHTGDIKVYTTWNWEGLRKLEGHSDRVWSVKYSLNGDQMVSGSNDKTVRLWYAETGECYNILNGHEGIVFSVAYSPQGDTVASASMDKTVRLWNVENGECSHILTGHDEGVLSVTYSPTGRQIVTGSTDKTVRLWDAETRNCLHTLTGHDNDIRCVAYSPQGDTIASASEDSTIRLWDVETASHRCTLTGHNIEIYSIAYSPRGDLLASGSWDKTVRLWNIDTETCLHIFTGHTGGIMSIAFSPKGDHIASGSTDDTVRLWDIEVGTFRHLSSGYSQGVLKVNYSSKSGQVASSSRNGTIRLWDAETGSHRHTLRGHSESSPIKSIEHSPDGSLIASASDDETVRLWDVETGTCRHILSEHSSYVRVVTYSPRGDRVASSGLDRKVKVWDVGTGECLQTLTGHTQTVIGVVYSPDGNRIASGSEDNTVRLWDSGTGDCHHILTGHTKWVLDLAYSPQGGTVASASRDMTVRLWDVESGACLHDLTGHTGWVGVVKYSPKGDQVASGSNDGKVRLWDVENGTCCYELAGHSNLVSSIAYSPDGGLLASGSNDFKAQIWDVASGQRRAVIQGIQAFVNDIAWSSRSDVHYLITGCEDGSVREWHMVEEEDLCRMNLCWSSSNDRLTLKDVSVQDVRSLSQVNKRLLKQRGAVGEPIHHLREASKTVTSMLSTISKLKQLSEDVVLESSSTTDPSNK